MPAVRASIVYMLLKTVLPSTRQRGLRQNPSAVYMAAWFLWNLRSRLRASMGFCNRLINYFLNQHFIILQVTKNAKVS